MALCAYRRRRTGRPAEAAGRAARSRRPDRMAWRAAAAGVLAAYREADLFVLAAKIASDGDRDGLPNVLMEAQSQHLACVATRLPRHRRADRGRRDRRSRAARRPACPGRSARGADPRPGPPRPARRRRRGARAPRFRHAARHRPAGGAVRTAGRTPRLWLPSKPGRRMRIAFYAPLKPPDHPVPSGDRRIAGLLLEALRLAGHDRSSPRGCAASTATAIRRGRPAWPSSAAAAARLLLRRWRRDPAARAAALVHLPPVLQGAGLAWPAVSRALGIPYVIAEASTRRSG